MTSVSDKAKKLIKDACMVKGVELSKTELDTLALELLSCPNDHTGYVKESLEQD